MSQMSVYEYDVELIQVHYVRQQTRHLSKLIHFVAFWGFAI